MEDEDAVLRQAMAIARARRDPAKLADHARAIGEARRGVPASDEHRAKLREAQAVRREREKQERSASGTLAAPVAKRKAGRPAKVKPEPDSAETPRPRGRPKKQAGQNTIISAGTLETGAGGQETA